MASGPRKWEEMDGWMEIRWSGNYLHITKEYIPRTRNTILFFRKTIFIKSR